MFSVKQKRNLSDIFVCIEDTLRDGVTPPDGYSSAALYDVHLHSLSCVILTNSSLLYKVS